MKVLISKKTGIYYYYKEGDFHCKEGTIKCEDLKGDVRCAVSNTRREFIVTDANFVDLKEKMKRGPQILMAKDLGYICARTGIGKEAFVVEAGGGSGGATSFFSKICKKVHTYEIKEENCKIIEKNIGYLNLNNVKLFNDDLSEKISKEKDIDLLFLDMPEPECVLKQELSGVKSGHFIVCYVPSISQVQEITKVVAEKEDLYLEEISEVILRHWKVWDRISRPEHRKDNDHTAFLVFLRKI